MPHEMTPPETTPHHTRIESNGDYEAALDTVIGKATRRLRLFDRTLGRSFDNPRRQEALRRFLLANRANRCEIVLHEVENLGRDCPRLTNLLRQFSHAISIHQTLPDAHGACDPFAIADEQHFVHRFHYDDTRGLLALDDPHAASPLLERFAEILAVSVPVAAPTTLGL